MNFADYITEAMAFSKDVEKLVKKYKKLQTNDYQNRGGNYPSSGIPDTIHVNGYKNEFFIEAAFKNTSEREAIKWMTRELGSAAKQFKISAHQDGDYKDDWVIGTAAKTF